MGQELYPLSNHESPTGQMETLETFQDKGSRAYQPEGPGESSVQEVGRETALPPPAVIPHLAPLQGDNEPQEFFDLLGDTRFRTLRQRCLVIEQMMKWGLPIPWQETHVRHLLNDLRSQEVTPHKLQLCWDTLRWFSKKFGMMAVHEEHRLLQKKQTVEDSLTPAVTQPSRKAKVPPKEVIWALEEGAPRS